MTDLSDDEIEALNTRAFGALMGFSSNGKADLAALLRSDAPISPAVRDELAGAIEGGNSAGIAMDLRDHDPQKRRIEGLLVRRQWREDGLKVAPFVKLAGVERGFAMAAEKFGSGEDNWRKLYYYSKSCDEWVCSARSQGGTYAIMTETKLQDIWHIAALSVRGKKKPTPPTSEEYGKIQRKRIRFLRAMIDSSPSPWSKEKADFFIGLMLSYADIAPPDNP